MKEIIIAIIGSGALSAAVSGIIALINSKRAEKREKEKASKDDYMLLAEALKSISRVELMRAHKEYASQGFCPADEKYAIQDLYKSYHALGGNDVATSWYNDIIGLPDYYVSK